MFKNYKKDDRFKDTIKYYKKPFFIILCFDLIFIILYVVTQSYLLNKVNYFLIVKIIVNLILFVFLLLTINPTLNLRRCKFYCDEVEAFISSIKNDVSFMMIDGAAGSGKSLTISYLTYYKSIDKMRTLYLDCIINEARLRDNTFSFKNIKEYWLYISEKQSKEFFQKNKYKLPCCALNYKIVEKSSGKESYTLTKEHLLGFKRLGELTTSGYDEIAQDFSCKDSNKRDDEALALNDLTSKNRHYGRFTFQLAEQDNTESQKDIRRVTSLNRTLLRLERELEPQKLIDKLSILETKILENDFCCDKDLLNYSKLKNKINKIGFLKIHYQDRASIEKGKGVTDEGFYVIPKNLPYYYDDREFFLDYKVLTKPIEML